MADAARVLRERGKSQGPAAAGNVAEPSRAAGAPRMLPGDAAFTSTPGSSRAAGTAPRRREPREPSAGKAPPRPGGQAGGRAAGTGPRGSGAAAAAALPC